MSKAFTKEEDDVGLVVPTSRAHVLRSPVTALGVRAARERLAAVAARLTQVTDAGERAKLELEQDRLTALSKGPVVRGDGGGAVTFGAQVRVRDSLGRERVFVIASADEVGLLAGAMSVTSPLAQALLGAAKGDRVQVEGFRGKGELLVVDVSYPE